MIHSGMRIPAPQSKGRNTILNVSYARKIVAVCNAILNLKVKGGKFLLSDSNSLLDLTPTELASLVEASLFHPFKIMLVPEDLCIDPATYGRTYQVRSGFASFRPKWYVEAPPIRLCNSEPQYYIQRGTDQVAGEGLDFETPDMVMATESVAVANTGDHGASSSSAVAEFVLDADLDSDDERNAAFFIKFDDSGSDATPPVYQVLCRMVTNQPADPTGRTTQPFDPDPTVIPIGIANNDPTFGLYVEQRLFDHVLNRYGQFPHLGPMNYRGNWTDDSLSGQVFYPGDVVLYVTGSGPFDYRQYIRLNYGAGSTVPSADGNWQLIASGPF